MTRQGVQREAVDGTDSRRSTGRRVSEMTGETRVDGQPIRVGPLSSGGDVKAAAKIRGGGDAGRCTPYPKPPKRPVRARTSAKKRRSKPRRQVGRCPQLLAWIHSQRCWLTANALWGPVEAAHLPRTKRLGGDLFNVIPLARDHHQKQHRVGIKTWLVKIGCTLDELTAAARDYTLRFAQETGYVLPGEGL